MTASQDFDAWNESLAVLSEVPTAAATAAFVPRTSMADLFFTLPDEPFPWRNIVRVSRNSPTRFELQLSREGVPVTIDRATEKDAPAMLDAFLTDLSAEA